MPYATYRFNKIIAAETIRFIVTVAIVVYKGLKLVVYRMLTKIMSCRFSCFARDFVYHQYGICSMYPEENPQYFGLPVPCLYPGERIMLLLGTETAFKSGGSLL